MDALAHAAHEAFVWHGHPDVWLLVVAVVAGYVIALRAWGPREAPAGEEVVTSRQKVWFAAGVVALWFGADWPIHDLAEDFLFSAHMVQHTLFSLVAPPLFLLGTPRWLLRKLLAPAGLNKRVRFLTRPLIAFIIFNVVIAVTHWGAIVDATLRSEPLHFTVHTILVGSAFLMWWPVVAPLPEMARLSVPGKMLYLFGQSIVPTVPASFLTFAKEPIYEFYTSVPRLWGIDVVTDQQIAGLIMKIGGGLLLWSIIAVMFFRWHSQEQRDELHELSWDDFERELQAWELRK